jgi:hypothetical protein
MSPRNTWLWVTLALGVFAFIFFFERHWREPESRPPRVLPELKAAAVTSIQVRRSGQFEIRADRTNHTWQLTRPLHYPAAAPAIEDLLRALEQLQASTHLGAAELRQHTNTDEEFGFDAPQASVQILQENYRHQLLVGARTAQGDQVFLQVPGEGIFVADAALLKLLPASANDWRDLALVDLGQTSFDRISVTNAGAAFVLQRGSDQLWRLAHPLPARADATNVQAALHSLENLRVTRFVTDDPKADAEGCGLQPPELSLTFAQGTNTTLQLQFGKSPTNDSRQVFARRLGWPTIVTVAREPLAPWRADFTSFRDRHLLSLTQPVEAIEVRGPEAFTLQRVSSNSWRVLPLDLPGDAELVEDLIATLCNLLVANFENDIVTQPGLARYGLATPSRQVVVRAAAATGKGQSNTVLAELHFGATQDDKIYVRRTDEDSVYALRAADVQRLPSAAFQFRERRIWSFTEEQVAGLTIHQSGKVRQLSRKGTNSWSFALNSQGMINDFAVEEAVHRLGELSAVVWTAIGEQNLASLGFNPDGLQLEVQLKSGDKLGLRFGGIAPSQLTYAATSLTGQTWVFECPPAVSELARAYLTIPANVP